MLDATAFGYHDFGFSWGDHICAVFDDRAQQMEIMGAFVATGLRAVQRCVWVAPQESSDALRDALADIGGDLATLESSGQLLIISEVEFYLHEGIFEPGRTMELLSTILEDNRREGYSTMRVASDVSWLGDRSPSPELWERFEARLTREVSNRPLVMVCQYSRRQVSGSILVAALHTHPIMILGDKFRQNPFYLSDPLDAPGPREIL
ncbi:MAG: MEDS domain-containing protein [Armatimonadota bacterium]|nr:MAG: MEDS domain-containing protein [Armatimonadota bacterium]